MTLSVALPDQVTVAYNTVMETAKANDLTSVSGTLTFPPGTTTLGIKVPVTADTRVEPDESFTLRLFNATRGVTLHRGLGTGTVLADDM